MTSKLPDIAHATVAGTGPPAADWQARLPEDGRSDGRTGSAFDRFHWASNGFVPPREAGGEEGGHGAAVVGKVGGRKEAESETSP